MNLNKLYYYGEGLKSAVPQGSDTPQDAYNILTVDFDELSINGSILPYIEWTVEGITTDLDVAKEALKNNLTNPTIKRNLEQGAFQQQNSIIDENMSQFLWDMFKNFDLEACPIAKNYKAFLDALWLEYHTRKALLTEDYDFTAIIPVSEYSYAEIEAEYTENRT